MSKEARGFSEKKFTKDDVQDLAKMGSDLFKKTVASGFTVIKEVAAELPKEASQIISKGKEEMIKNFSKDAINSTVDLAIEKFFEKLREHKFEISIGLKQVSKDKKNDDE